MSLRWLSYVVPKRPKGGGLKNVVCKICTRAFDWYRPRLPWMTLNGVIPLFFSPNSIALQADYVTVVENRPIMSVKYCLPVPVFHFWPKLTHPAARSLCDSWATCKAWRTKCGSSLAVAAAAAHIILLCFAHSLHAWLQTRPFYCKVSL